MKDHRAKTMRPLSLVHFYILTALAGEDQNRAEIRRRAIEDSHGECGSIKNFASILAGLVKRGWIGVDSFQRRTENRPGAFYYHLLPAGRAALVAEVKRLGAVVEKVSQKLRLAKQQLSLPAPPPFKPRVPEIRFTLPPDRATKKIVHLSALRDLRKRKMFEALRQKPNMSVQEAAECLGVNRDTICRWCRKGILERTNVDGEQQGRAWQVTTASLLRVVESQRNE